MWWWRRIDRRLPSRAVVPPVAAWTVVDLPRTRPEPWPAPRPGPLAARFPGRDQPPRAPPGRWPPPAAPRLAGRPGAAPGCTAPTAARRADRGAGAAPARRGP